MSLPGVKFDLHGPQCGELDGGKIVFPQGFMGIFFKRPREGFVYNASSYDLRNLFCGHRFASPANCVSCVSRTPTLTTVGYSIFLRLSRGTFLITFAKDTYVSTQNDASGIPRKIMLFSILVG